MRVIRSVSNDISKKINEYYLCPNCGNTYRVKGYINYRVDKISERTKKERYFENDIMSIFCKECETYAFRCDKAIVKLIRKLNLSGLETWVCCSGHIEYDDKDYFYSSAYIGFVKRYKVIEKLFNTQKIKYWVLEERQCNARRPFIPSYTIRVNTKILDKIYTKGDKKGNIKRFNKFKKKYLKELDFIVSWLIDNHVKEEDDNINLPDNIDAVFITEGGGKYSYNEGFIYKYDDSSKFIGCITMTELLNKMEKSNICKSEEE